MAYYFFNKCERECLPSLERLAQEMGLAEKVASSPSIRFWSGRVIKSREEFYQELLMSYDPTSPTPLMVQTNLEDHLVKQVKEIIIKLIKLTDPSEIYQEPFGHLKYDLKDFED
ncbi:Uncharacterised protein [uncultured archaeon]|nr:Uncharacterised protein [uncultured archaeon]